MKRISIGVFGPVCTGKTSILETMCTKETNGQHISKELEIIEKVNRSKPQLYRKETLNAMIQLLDAPSFIEDPLYMIDKIELFDGILLVIDILAGLTEAIFRILAENKTSRIIVIVNKIDALFGKDSECIYIECYKIISVLDDYAPNQLQFCISSATYDISLFFGVLDTFYKESFLNTINTIYSVLNIADMHQRDAKRIFWDKKYYEVIDRAGEKYRKNKLLGSICDILVHAEGVASLSQQILLEIEKIPERKESEIHSDIISVENYHSITNRMSFIVRKSDIKSQMSITHNSNKYKITRILSDSKENKMHAVQIENEESLLCGLIREKRHSLHSMAVVVSGISEKEQTKLESVSILYPGLRIKKDTSKEKDITLCKHDYTIRVYSIGPYTLEAFMQEILFFTNPKSTRISHPVYNIKKTPLAHNSFDTKVEDVLIRIEIASNLDQMGYSHVQSMKKLKNTKQDKDFPYFVKLDDEDSNYLQIKTRTIGDCRNKLATIIVQQSKEFISCIKRSPYALDVEHATITAEALEVCNSNAETPIQTGFNKCRYRIIETHAVSQIVIQMDTKCVPRSSSDAFLNKLISKKSVKSLIKTITKQHRGHILSYAENKFLSVAKLHVSLPGANYMDFISLVSTFFKSFIPYILYTHYVPVETDIHQTVHDNLPAEVFLSKKAKEE